MMSIILIAAFSGIAAAVTAFVVRQNWPTRRGEVLQHASETMAVFARAYAESAKTDQAITNLTLVSTLTREQAEAMVRQHSASTTATWRETAESMTRSAAFGRRPPPMSFLDRWPVPPHLGGLPPGRVLPRCVEPDCSRSLMHVGRHEDENGWWW